METPEDRQGFFARNRWIVWTLGIIAGVIVLASFMSRDETVPVRTAKVQRTTMRSVISTNGKIETVRNFEAHAPIGANVRRVLVNEGDHVEKGQLLVQLNDVTRDAPKDMRHWPASPEALAHRLPRLAPVLRAQGIEVRREARQQTGQKGVRPVPLLVHLPHS